MAQFESVSEVAMLKSRLEYARLCFNTREGGLFTNDLVLRLCELWNISSDIVESMRISAILKFGSCDELIDDIIGFKV